MFQNPYLSGYNMNAYAGYGLAKLHKAVVVLIENYREKQGQPPAEMMAVYEYLHKKHIEKAAEIKVMQGMFKE